MTFLDDIVTKSFPSVFVDGRRLPDAVTAFIGQSRIVYDAWENIQIGRSIESISGTFEISLTDKWRTTGEVWPFQPGQPVHIKIGNESVINGYIYKTDVSGDNENRKVQIAGRDKTGDIVDCSAFIVDEFQQPSEFKNIDIKTLANKFLKQFEINVTVAPGVSIGATFTKFVIKPGETIFEMLERAAKLRGLLLLSDDKGDLLITNRAGGDIGQAPSVSGATSSKDIFNRPSVKNLVPSFAFKGPSDTTKKADVDLIQGQNILSAQASYDQTDRYQTYIVKGQSAGSDVFNRKNVSGVFANSKDAAVLRSRTKLVIADGSIDKVAAQKRANWEMIVRATKACDVNVTVQGWQQTLGGRLWQVNELVRIEAGFVGIRADMLISAVQFSKSLDGTFTNLKLTRPDAYNPDKDNLTVSSDPSQNLGWGNQGIGDIVKKIKEVFG